MDIFYRIELQDNIDELLEYRMNRGYDLKDNRCIFVKPSTMKGYQFMYKDKIVSDAN